MPGMSGERNMSDAVMRDIVPGRGLRPHHAQRDGVGTWETSCRPQSLEGPVPDREAPMSNSGPEYRRRHCAGDVGAVVPLARQKAITCF